MKPSDKMNKLMKGRLKQNENHNLFQVFGAPKMILPLPLAVLHLMLPLPSEIEWPIVRRSDGVVETFVSFLERKRNEGGKTCRTEGNS